LPAVSVPQIIAADCEGWEVLGTVLGVFTVLVASGIDVPGAMDMPGDMDMVGAGVECAFPDVVAFPSPLALPVAQPASSSAPATSRPACGVWWFMSRSDSSNSTSSCWSFVTASRRGLVDLVRRGVGRVARGKCRQEKTGVVEPVARPCWGLPGF